MVDQGKYCEFAGASDHKHRYPSNDSHLTWEPISAIVGSAADLADNPPWSTDQSVGVMIRGGVIIMDNYAHLATRLLSLGTGGCAVLAPDHKQLTFLALKLFESCVRVATLWVFLGRPFC